MAQLCPLPSTNTFNIQAINVIYTMMLGKFLFLYPAAFHISYYSIFPWIVFILAGIGMLLLTAVWSMVHYYIFKAPTTLHPSQNVLVNIILHDSNQSQLSREPGDRLKFLLHMPWPYMQIRSQEPPVPFHSPLR